MPERFISIMGSMTTPMNSPNENSEGSLNTDNTVKTHTDLATKLPEEIKKIEYIYQHFQDCEKIHKIDPHAPTEHINDIIYPQINNDIEYGLFENVIDSYYLDSQISDDFTCTKACYVHNNDNNILETRPQCTYTYDHISQQLNSLADTKQQHQVYTSEVDTSLLTSDTSTQCACNIVQNHAETDNEKPMEEIPQNNTGIHFHSKHKYRDTFGDAHVQYHDFDNGDAFTYKDKHTALLQQELQNPYWCLHDPVTTKSYQISMEMDIETMPHVMYFSGNPETVTRINHVPHQTAQYDDKGMFPAKLMDDTPIQVFIDNGATPSILLITNTQYCKNIQRPRAPHPSIQEVVQLSLTN